MLDLEMVYSASTWSFAEPQGGAFCSIEHFFDILIW